MDFEEPSVRDSIDRWMRMLTVHGDKDLSRQEQTDLLRQVNPPISAHIAFSTKLTESEKHALADAVAQLGKRQTYETAAHLAIDELLIGWLAQATDQSRSEILQRLGLMLSVISEDIS
jgi:hypothetical protein